MWEQGSRLIRRINCKIGNPLEWTSCAKAMLLAATTCVLFLHYGMWGEFLLHSEPHSDWIQRDYLGQQIPYVYGFAIASLVLLVGLPFVKKAMGDQVAFEYIATFYFVLSLCYFSYQIGTLTLPVGAVMLGAPIVGFIFYNRLAVGLSMVVGFVVQVVLSSGSAKGWWPYAPMYINTVFTEGKPSMFIVFHYYLYVLPYMVFLIGISYLVLRRWRDREEKVRHLSVTDPLTGLFNRRSILTHLEQEQDRSRKKGPVLSVFMVDLDHFKSINDELGHEVGDYALIAAADSLQKSLRQNDRVGRYGGEEFLVILPGTDLHGAKMIAERCRQLLEKAQVILQDGNRLKITGSFGLVSNEGNVHMSVNELLRKADKAMYQAKQQGRNRVVTDAASLP